MRRVFLALLLLPLTGCVGDMMGDHNTDCHPTPLTRSYDVTVTCAGGASYQGRALFDGELSGNLNGEGVSGNLDLIDFTMNGSCSSAGSSPYEVEVSFRFHTDKQGRITATDDYKSPRAYCGVSTSGQPPTASCFKIDYGGGDVDCQATVTPVP